MENLSNLDFKKGFIRSLNVSIPKRGYFVKVSDTEFVTPPEDEEVRQYLNLYSDMLSDDDMFFGGYYDPERQRYLLEIWMYVAIIKHPSIWKNRKVYDITRQKYVDGEDL
jgi:hypothetical protein